MRQLVSLAILVSVSVSLRCNTLAQERLAVPVLSFDDSRSEEDKNLPLGIPPAPKQPVRAGKRPIAVNRKPVTKSSGTGAVAPLRARVRLRPAAGGNAKPLPKPRSVRVNNDVPNMRVVTKGPDTLTVGKSARFVIELSNQSSFAGKEVVVRCAIPAWVKLAKEAPTSGKVRAVAGMDAIEWTLESVRQKSTEQLLLDLVPQRGKAFDLNVELAVQPRRTRQQITIREAGLKLAYKGPDSFAFDDTPKCQVTVSNPGTAPTDNVVLNVVGGGHSLAETPIGMIPAGGSRTIDLTLSARQTGSIPLEFFAKGQPGVQDRVAASVRVRRGLPVVQVTGSAFEFAGGHSTYVVRVENQGDAPLKDLLVELNLPNGSKYIDGLQQPRVRDGRVSWRIASIEQGGQAEFPITLQLNQQGQHEFLAKAIAAEDLVSNDSTTTAAETAADLKLEVITPRGPQPIGDLVEYEVRVRNIGTATASDISVLAVCAPELSPVKSTGDPAIRNGQVIFRPIAQIERGKQVVYKIQVRAVKAGSHSFRVAVMSRRPALRFASEDTTRYYDRTTRATNFADRQGENGIN